MKLIKLIGSKTEEDIRNQLLRSHKSLFQDEGRKRILSIVRTYFPEMKTAYIIAWTPDQGEDIITFLINNNIIADIEIDRIDTKIEPIIESKLLNNNYIKGLRKIPQITLAIAIELANRDLES
ncbi:hypothetical protein [Paenibacillus solanacearum]|uniref:hypothetical protein n=1 Tax=Paenibacillus solanacearum TaxID=2048548 RepID=UPI001FE4DC54|nr:hypothetical protein [Paenibacillus solanacearum]